MAKKASPSTPGLAPAPLNSNYDPLKVAPRTYGELRTWHAYRMAHERTKGRLPLPAAIHSPDATYIFAYLDSTYSRQDVICEIGWADLTRRYMLATGKYEEQVDATAIADVAAFLRPKKRPMAPLELLDLAKRDRSKIRLGSDCDLPHLCHCAEELRGHWQAMAATGGNVPQSPAFLARQKDWRISIPLTEVDDFPLCPRDVFEAYGEVIRFWDGHIKQENGERTEGSKPKRRRGRKPDTDAKKDQRVAEAWQSGQYKTHEQCGQAIGMTRKQVKHALDRHRKRPGGKRRRTVAPE
jgi:hypothetical protein